MNKLILGSIILALTSLANANSVKFTDEDYTVNHVNISLPGCAGRFGETLQEDLNQDPIDVIMSATFSISFNYGSTTLVAADSITGAHIISDQLFPMQLSEQIYSFGHYIDPLTIIINNHNYLIYALQFKTYGDDTDKWIKNGVPGIQIINPNSKYSCIINSAQM